MMYRRPLHILPVALVSLLVLSVFCACREEDALGVAGINTRGMPTMTTRNVMTIISDSGIPQYRMVSPLWLVYDNVDTPLWILPGGPYLEKFDRNYNIVFTVAADSAVNNRLTQQWTLHGNVEFKQGKELLILTQHLVWDQREQLVFSDSFIHIEQPDKIIEGYGFEGHTTARGNLSSYTLYKPTGVLPFDKSRLMSPGVPTAGEIGATLSSAPAGAGLPPSAGGPAEQGAMP